MGRFFKNFLSFLTQNRPKVQEASLTLEAICKYCSDTIKHIEINEDLQKLFRSHPKDFAIQGKLAEISIIQCDFTNKIKA